MRDKAQSGMHRRTSTSERIAFVRRKGRYYPAKQTKLKNNLLAGVGFLELANSLDFAANVWNTIPVPLFAVILMGFGATVALALSFFAFQDAILSRRNILLLRDERRHLKQRRADEDHENGMQSDVHVQLDVSFKEMGVEMIDRIGMDSCLGFGAILVGVGTFMAIGGANPRVFEASNLLSGYIGNTPSAVYGTINVGWSIYVWRRAHCHAVAGARYLKTPDIKTLQKERITTIKLHATLNGLTGLFGGIAGIITAKQWQGYVVLVPCIVSAIYCNRIWRLRLGYERPSILQSPSVDHHETAEEIRLAALAQKLLKEAPVTAFKTIILKPQSLSYVMDFIVMHGFFEDFCIRLFKESDLVNSLFGSSHSELEVDSLSILSAETPSILRLLEIAEASVKESGLSIFRDRQRFLLEKLGCQLCAKGYRPEGIEMHMKKLQDVGQEETPTSTGASVTSSGRDENVEVVAKKISEHRPIKSSPSMDIPVATSGGKGER